MELTITKIHFNLSFLLAGVLLACSQRLWVQCSLRCPPECWQCWHSSWLLIIALIVVWQPELQERNVMNIQKLFYKIWSDYKFHLSFFLLLRYDICTYKNKPCGTLGKFFNKGRIVQIVFLDQWLYSLLLTWSLSSLAHLKLPLKIVKSDLFGYAIY